MEEVIPERLMSEGQRDNFLAWLRGLDIDTQDKKQLLMFWVDRVGIKVTGDMVKRAGID